jgi:hypothetical protein
MWFASKSGCVYIQKLSFNVANSSLLTIASLHFGVKITFKPDSYSAVDNDGSGPVFFRIEINKSGNDGVLEAFGDNFRISH